MSYPSETILIRRDPKGDELDTVKVIGASPIKAATVADWAGAGGEAIIVAPHGEFGANQIMPLSVAAEQYVISWMPEAPGPVVIDPRRASHVRLVSPEETFAAAVREDTKAKKPKAAAKPPAVTT